MVASRRHGGRNRKLEQELHILNFKHEAERENWEWCGVSPPKPPQAAPTARDQVSKYLSLHRDHRYPGHCNHHLSLCEEMLTLKPNLNHALGLNKRNQIQVFCQTRESSQLSESQRHSKRASHITEELCKRRPVGFRNP